ncbi:hypothetical protein Tco_0890714 [Tanacetum coccineum]|uniref:Uncharacterized protein n=1 Tax=Tanacetum coccineum TaxID=301880 RepID=A0ABQ5C3W0_9ASTR
MYKNDNQTGQFGSQRAVNVVGARDTIGGQVVQQSGIQCLNCKEFDEKGVQLQAEQSDWIAETDEEIDEQELEAHYSYMAKIQEVPNADLGTDAEPLEQVQYDTDDNVFANDIQHFEQSESIICSHHECPTPSLVPLVSMTLTPVISNNLVWTVYSRSLCSIQSRSCWPEMAGTTILARSTSRCWVPYIYWVHIPRQNSTIPQKMTWTVTIETHATRPSGYIVGVIGGTLRPNTRILSSYRV